MADRELSHYSIFAFTEFYWQQSAKQRQIFLKQLKGDIPGLGERVFLYSIYPARAESDLMLWSAAGSIGPEGTGQFFRQFATTTSSWRAYLKPVDMLWGFTRPSQYASGKSSQELDPMAPERGPYLVVYPFHKTAEWYLMSRKLRQEMMNEHIRVGRQYPEISQLLLYCTGLEDQEFVVVYETEDLPHFSGLVSELRSTEGRKYTLRDTPIYTATHLPLEQMTTLWA